ncbi:MAG: phosphate ABC transporter ATP-binding protein [Solirubrobacterales bacterium]
MNEQPSPPPLQKIEIAEQPRVVDSHDVIAAPSANGNGQATAQPFGQFAAGMLRHRDGEVRAGGRERMRTEQFGVAYAGKPAVTDVNLPIRQGEVLALIGPSGCGKTTLLRSLNRLTELTSTATHDGRILLDDQDIFELNANELRRKVSMVFQQPNPFPMSVFDNVAYALREQGARRPSRDELHPQVVHALERAGLIDEVKDDLNHPALRLSGGQQQRLCIARALAASPEVILLDEPCSALDPKSTAVIEELIVSLKNELAVVIVTHNMQQAYRVADHTAFMYLGELVEYGETEQIFGEPGRKRTRDYLAGAFG